MSEELYKKVELDESGEESLDDLLERINAGSYEDPDFKPFTIECDIGKDDYRAFFYYSVIFKNPIMSVILAVLPVVAAAVIAYNDNVFNAAKFGFFAVLFYLLVVGLVVFRAENSMKKIQRSSPETLRLTKTVYSFKTNAIFYTKNGATIKVPYKNFLKIGKTKMRYFLYFAGQKAMVIRTENVQEVMPVEEFDKFIKSKVKEL